MKYLQDFLHNFSGHMKGIGLFLCGYIEDIVKLSSSYSSTSSQIKLNWDSLIITLKPPTPPNQPRKRYFKLNQEAEIWYAS